MIKDFKQGGMMIPNTSIFNSPIWPVQKKDGFQRMTVDYCKLNQKATPIAVVVPDMVSWFEQINISPSSGIQLLIWQVLFSWYVSEEHQK